MIIFYNRDEVPIIVQMQCQTIPVGLQRRGPVLAASADAESDFQRAAATGKCQVINFSLTF